MIAHAIKDPKPRTTHQMMQAVTGCVGYLGNRNIQHTVRYTELSPGRFKDFWR